MSVAGDSLVHSLLLPTLRWSDRHLLVPSPSISRHYSVHPWVTYWLRAARHTKVQSKVTELDRQLSPVPRLGRRVQVGSDTTPEKVSPPFRTPEYHSCLRELPWGAQGSISDGRTPPCRTSRPRHQSSAMDRKPGLKSGMGSAPRPVTCCTPPLQRLPRWVEYNTLNLVGCT